MKAADFLEAQGFDVVSVAGGTRAWISAGKDVSFEESK
jgi:rhodanese-related sulfurtransferase